MLTIQYIIPADYDRQKTLLVAGVLIKSLVEIIKDVNKNKEYSPSDFVFYPLNTFQIAKTKKMLISGRGLGLKILNKIDTKFLDTLKGINLKVNRMEFKK